MVRDWRRVGEALLPKFLRQARTGLTRGPRVMPAMVRNPPTDGPYHGDRPRPIVFVEDRLRVEAQRYLENRYNGTTYLIAEQAQWYDHPVDVFVQRQMKFIQKGDTELEAFRKTEQTFQEDEEVQAYTERLQEEQAKDIGVKATDVVAKMDELNEEANRKYFQPREERAFHERMADIAAMCRERLAERELYRSGQKTYMTDLEDSQHEDAAEGAASGSEAETEAESEERSSEDTEAASDKKSDDEGMQEAGADDTDGDCTDHDDPRDYRWLGGVKVPRTWVPLLPTETWEYVTMNEMKQFYAEHPEYRDAIDVRCLLMSGPDFKMYMHNLYERKANFAGAHPIAGGTSLHFSHQDKDDEAIHYQAAMEAFMGVLNETPEPDVLQPELARWRLEHRKQLALINELTHKFFNHYNPSPERLPGEEFQFPRALYDNVAERGEELIYRSLGTGSAWNVVSAGASAPNARQAAAAHSSDVLEFSDLEAELADPRADRLLQRGGQEESDADSAEGSGDDGDDDTFSLSYPATLPMERYERRKDTMFDVTAASMKRLYMYAKARGMISREDEALYDREFVASPRKVAEAYYIVMAMNAWVRDALLIDRANAYIHAELEIEAREEEEQRQLTEQQKAEIFEEFAEVMDEETRLVESHDYRLLTEYYKEYEAVAEDKEELKRLIKERRQLEVAKAERAASDSEPEHKAADGGDTEAMTMSEAYDYRQDLAGEAMAVRSAAEWKMMERRREVLEKSKPEWEQQLDRMILAPPDEVEMDDIFRFLKSREGDVLRDLGLDQNAFDGVPPAEAIDNTLADLDSE